MDPSIEHMQEAYHVVISHLVLHQEICLLELPGLQVELCRAVSEPYDVQCIRIVGGVVRVIEHLYCGAIITLFKLVGTFKEHAALLHFIHLTDERDVLV